MNEVENKKIRYTQAILDAIASKKLLTLHTHPDSFPPSEADFTSAFRHGYFQNLVICHDGKVFAYNSNDDIDSNLYLAYIAKFKKIGYNEYEAQIKALEEMAAIYDIYFEEV